MESPDQKSSVKERAWGEYLRPLFAANRTSILGRKQSVDGYWWPVEIQYKDTIPDDTGGMMPLAYSEFYGKTAAVESESRMGGS